MCMDMPTVEKVALDASLNYVVKSYDRVSYMIENSKRLEEERHQFSIKHGFAYKRPQYFKNCLVIGWKHRKRKDKNFIDYDRIKEYAALCHEMSEKYKLYDEKDPLLDCDLRLLKIGIYSSYSFFKTWAIPNEFQEIQEYILQKLPEWAVVKKTSLIKEQKNESFF